MFVNFILQEIDPERQKRQTSNRQDMSCLCVCGDEAMAEGTLQKSFANF